MPSSMTAVSRSLPAGPALTIDNRDEAGALERTAARRVWAINGDFLTLQPTGVARYAREVTTQLDALSARVIRSPAGSISS